MITIEQCEKRIEQIQLELQQLIGYKQCLLDMKEKSNGQVLENTGTGGHENGPKLDKVKKTSNNKAS